MSESIDKKPSAAEFREYALGNLDTEHQDVHPIAGHIQDKDVRHLVMFYASVYDPSAEEFEGEDMPASFWATAFAEEVVQKFGTDTAQTALETRNLDLLESYSGLVGYNLDFSAFRAIEEMESLWEDYPTFQMYLFGPKPPVGPVGVGKTDFAYLTIEIGRRVYENLSVASNNTGDEFETITSWSELEHWLKTTPGKKVFLLDEAAQVLQFADMNAGKVVSKLLKLLRKYDGNIVIIGHTGRDVPRDVRRQLLVAKKESKKEVVIGTGLHEENEVISVADPLLEIGGIPQTRLDYDTLDTSTFEFDVDADHTSNDSNAPGDGETEGQGEVDTPAEGIVTSKADAVLDYITSDDGLRPVAERHGVSRETLRNWADEYTGDN